MKYLPSGAVCYFRTWAVLEAFFGQKLAESRSTKDDTGQEVMMKQYCLSTMKGGYADEWHEA